MVALAEGTTWDGVVRTTRAITSSKYAGYCGIPDELIGIAGWKAIILNGPDDGEPNPYIALIKRSCESGVYWIVIPEFGLAGNCIFDPTQPSVPSHITELKALTSSNVNEVAEWMQQR